ncbi:putative membrane protein [Piscirickettsia salmonis LF-89 = ATCC VR-1361]|nr:putative membrane protein [Piscirickettsia salmonis LF-89 = ATCC VR-1361]
MASTCASDNSAATYRHFAICFIVLLFYCFIVLLFLKSR